jgi:hypothetical protein
VFPGYQAGYYDGKAIPGHPSQESTPCAATRSASPATRSTATATHSTWLDRAEPTRIQAEDSQQDRRKKHLTHQQLQCLARLHGWELRDLQSRVATFEEQPADLLSRLSWLTLTAPKAPVRAGEPILTRHSADDLPLDC